MSVKLLKYFLLIICYEFTPFNIRETKKKLIKMIFSRFQQGRADITPNYGRNAFYAIDIRYRKDTFGLRVRQGTRSVIGFRSRILGGRTGQKQYGRNVDKKIRFYG